MLRHGMVYEDGSLQDTANSALCSSYTLRGDRIGSTSDNSAWTLLIFMCTLSHMPAFLSRYLVTPWL